VISFFVKHRKTDIFAEELGGFEIAQKAKTESKR